MAFADFPHFRPSVWAANPMLVDFTVENFRSYREPMTLSLVADSTDDLDTNRVKIDDDVSLLRSAAIYGANASGKSNLLVAMYSLGELLENPMHRQVRERDTPLSAFSLDKESFERPTRFKVRFYVDRVLYQYQISLNREQVKEESLSAYPLGREQEWFGRVEGDIHPNKTHLRGPKSPLIEMTRPDGAFLAVAAAFNHPQLSAPAQWLAENLRDRVSYSVPWRRQEPTAKRLRDDPSFMRWANEFMRHADLGIQKLDVESQTVEFKRRVPDATGSKMEVRVEQEERFEAIFVHSGSEGITARFVSGQESLGTRRMYSMLSPMYDVLMHGRVAVIDELSASIHPTMVRKLIRLFQHPDSNPHGAQLVFATHDTTLLSGQLFRRDQVWFTEKNPAGATELYSLRDIKGVRADEPFEKSYLRGRYGAIPFFGEFDFPALPEPAPEQTKPGDPSGSAAPGA